MKDVISVWLQCCAITREVDNPLSERPQVAAQAMEMLERLFPDAILTYAEQMSLSRTQERVRQRRNQSPTAATGGTHSTGEVPPGSYTDRL